LDPSELYDTPADVLAKAARALGRPAPSAAGPDQAADLGLDREAFARLGEHRPAPPLPAALTRLPLPFDDEHVNSWLIRPPDGETLVIDAGVGRDDLTRALAEHQVGDFQLLLTHLHRDHVAGAAKVPVERVHGPPGVNRGETLSPGQRLEFPPLEIEVLDLAGHHPTAVGYRIEGLDRSLVAVGDAVYAGSIGFCAGPEVFEQARRTIIDSLLALPDETILLPGHGPATTLGEERRGNPFLAAW